MAPKAKRPCKDVPKKQAETKEVLEAPVNEGIKINDTLYHLQITLTVLFQVILCL
jgi:hypothetical protein